MKHLAMILFVLLCGPITRAASDDSDTCIALLEGHSELELLFKKQGQNPLWTAWSKAKEKLPLIEAAMKNIPPTEQAYYGKILLAVHAALGKHQLVHARESNQRHLDIPRFNKILASIEDFDPSKPRFSLYKVKRAIEGRHSLTEFIECK